MRSICHCLKARPQLMIMYMFKLFWKCSFLLQSSHFVSFKLIELRFPFFVVVMIDWYMNKALIIGRFTRAHFCISISPCCRWERKENGKQTTPYLIVMMMIRHFIHLHESSSSSSTTVIIILLLLELIQFRSRFGLLTLKMANANYLLCCYIWRTFSLFSSIVT